MKSSIKPKTRTAVIAVIALVAAAGIAGALYYSGMLGPRAASPAQGLPHVFGTLTAATPTSITIAGPDGRETVLSVSAQTRVITQVAAGETGKTVEQLPLQSQVLVVQDTADKSVAVSISPLPSPPRPAPGVMLTSAEGTILSKTATGLMLQKDDGTPIGITVDASTQILSNVAAGETGKGFGSLAVGDRVGAVGTLNAGTSIDASVP